MENIEGTVSVGVQLLGGREAGLDNRNCWNYHLLNQWLMLGDRDKVVKDLGVR